MFDLVQKENKIFEMLKSFEKENLHFIIVGGYAVSAYKHRFSIDAELIIKKEEKERYEKILERK